LATAHALQQLRISFERKAKSDVDILQKNPWNKLLVENARGDRSSRSRQCAKMRV
jgi:hypothetical protein